MFDNSVVIKHPGGSITIRGEVGDDVNDLFIMQFPDGDILIKDEEDGDTVLISLEQANAVLSVLDLLVTEAEEEDEEFESEDELEWLRDAYEDGEIALTEEEREMLMDDEDFIDDEDVAEFMRGFNDGLRDFIDGEMDEYLV